MKTGRVLIMVTGLAFSAISFAANGDQDTSDFASRRLAAMYKSFAGTYLEKKQPNIDNPSGGDTLVSVFVKDGAITAYTVTPFSTVPHKTILSLSPFHRDYQVFLDDADLGPNAVGSLDSHRVTNGIERVEIRSGRFKRVVLTTKIVLNGGVLAITNTRQNFKRFAFFGPWVAGEMTFAGYLEATKIAARSVPVPELARLGNSNPDGYSVATGKGFFSATEIEESLQPEEMGRVIPFAPRKCAEIVNPETQE